MKRVVPASGGASMGRSFASVSSFSLSSFPSSSSDKSMRFRLGDGCSSLSSACAIQSFCDSDQSTATGRAGCAVLCTSARAFLAASRPFFPWAFFSRACSAAPCLSDTPLMASMALAASDLDTYHINAKPRPLPLLSSVGKETLYSAP